MSQMLPTLITVLVALVGSGGIVFGALRFNRDETGKTVTQHSAILSDMDKLNKHLVEELRRVRENLTETEVELVRAEAERDALKRQIGDCTGDVSQLQLRVRSLEQLVEDQEAHIQNLESLIAELRGQPRD